MVKISNEIRILELTEPNFFGTVLNHNLTVTKGPGGGLMLIDTGLPGYLEQIERYLKSWGYSLEDISDIVLTHSHPDHAGNAEEIRKISKAKIYAHELEKFENKKFPITYDQVKEEFNVSEEEFSSTIERINKLDYEIPTIDFKLKGGETIGNFKVIHVPGHTPGHIALYDGKVVIAGDSIRYYKGLKPPLKFFCWDYEKALKSFKTLVSLPYSFFIPYHGEVITPW
jgi:glyoxylase-like metal-dependent hydrolase (beta-lactamase superfamily II)